MTATIGTHEGHPGRGSRCGGRAWSSAASPMRLGGVPTGVPRPPTEAPQATARTSAVPSFAVADRRGGGHGDRQRDGGRGGVRHPHRQDEVEPDSAMTQGEPAARAPGQLAGQPAAEAVHLDRLGDEEGADEQEQERVAERGEHLPGGRQAGHDRERRGHEPGHRHRDRLGQPPDRAQDHERRERPLVGRQAAGQEPGQRRGERAEPEPESSGPGRWPGPRRR